MREIKFRCWIKVSQCFASWEQIQEKGNLSRLINSNHYTLDQFTGLKDSKGVDIYEGDILDNKIRARIGEVIFTGSSFKLRSFICDIEQHYLFENYSASDIVVVGNIHEGVK